jgi:hypothetical protein
MVTTMRRSRWGAASMSINPHLASVEHARQGGFLSGGDCEFVNRLDLHPHLSIRAVVRGYS